MQTEITKEQIEEALIERHTRLVQEKLAQARVAIAGLGGLGSNVAVYLVRVGVGYLHLIDFDLVDLTNLNRQQYSLKHLGKKKTEALKEQLMEINPYITIKTDCLKITRDHIIDLFQEEDIICEAFDVPEEKAMLVNGVLELLPEKILVGASGMAGFGNSNAIQTKKVMKNFYLCGDGITGFEKGNGLMAPRVAICAAHEANKIIELILSDEK
ncbi:MAG: sulfur carrier protein ThiS adenylyltransferase ThiF [Lachnospiraceae bacterium]|nr:sulfur carrier protein ThiS adenylyltransferase ThiF [Lachnospiraceae bacterium]